jgi:pimeloyl-ACP methyl ester carboxylesterase
VPVVFEYLPYRLWDDLRWRDDKTGDNLAPYGVAFVRVDIRGTGNSEGVMVDEYDVPELTDGVKIIAWLAKQSWSNGKVGMRGISWGGINALQVAALQPPELKAIMPMACILNRYTDDAHYMGGAYGEQNMGWGTSFKGHMAAPPDPKVVGERWEALWRQRLEATPAIMKVWSSHQRYDEYWKRGSPALDYDAIRSVFEHHGRPAQELEGAAQGPLGSMGAPLPQSGDALGARLAVRGGALVAAMARGRRHRHHARTDAPGVPHVQGRCGGVSGRGTRTVGGRGCMALAAHHIAEPVFRRRQ